MSILADFEGQVREVVALFIFLAITTALAFRAASLKRRVLHPMAERWDQVQGCIEHADVVTETRGKIDVSVAKLSYSYRVSGEYFSGEFTKDFLREQKAYDFIDSIKRGSEVIVRCHPSNPEVSVMRERDNSGLFARQSSRRT